MKKTAFSRLFTEIAFRHDRYLANDTQFYIIGAIILIIAIRHFRFAAAMLAIFMFSAWLTTGIIAYSNNHMPNTDDPLALFDKIYDKPWTRLGPYLVGMCVGWILFKTNCKIRFSKTQLCVGWTLSTGEHQHDSLITMNSNLIPFSGVLLYLLYGLYKTELSKFAAAAYSSLSHSAWAMALAWIVIACSTGNGGFLNSFLSASSLYPFSRVTYCAYLVHPIVIRAFALHSDSPLHMDIISMVRSSQTLTLVIDSHFSHLFISGNHLLRANSGFIFALICRVSSFRSSCVCASKDNLKARQHQLELIYFQRLP